MSLVNLGDVASRSGEFGLAEAFYDESFALRREIGEHGKMASSLSRLGDAALVGGHAAKADSYYREALRLSIEIHALPRIIQTLLGIARVLALAGRESEALKILAVIVRHPAAQSWYRDQADSVVAEISATLPGTIVVAAQARGAAMDLVELAEEVLKSDVVALA